MIRTRWRDGVVTAVFLALLLGCNLPTAVTPTVVPPTVDLTLAATAVPSPTATPPPTATTTALPTIAATATATSLPPVVNPATAVPNQPQFTNLRFSVSPANPPQTVFPLGTAEVFALWDYNGMRNGDVVQRVWRKDGVAWLNRQEIWSGGPTGVVTNVSIYDRGLGGLAPGNYEVDLTVNGVLQAYGQFVILSRPVSGNPLFTNLRFTAVPNGPAQNSFPAWTRQIFAVWDYQNMGVNDVVRRVWLKDGQPWLVREDAWDYLHYGPQGVVNDVSIYDFETGLPPGQYEMLLYLNGVVQANGAFVITP